MTALTDLVTLSRELGKPERNLVIIGEGNTSLRVDAETFWVKASGYQLPSIDAQGFTQVRFAPILDLFEHPPATQTEQKARLRAACVDASAPMPSIETSFHAMLLDVCQVNCIAHTHPTAVNRLMCSEHAELLATRRIFPDEAVLCGPESVFVPYADPGLPLGIAIREGVRQYMATYAEAPKVVLLGNHGLITLGSTPTEAFNITLMVVKAAEILWGALAIGEVRFMSREDILHIYRRPDEIDRRQLFMDNRS
ncbi:MAG: class II aldolase/adducin family protein [Phototrophicaceae bacterium]